MADTIEVASRIFSLQFAGMKDLAKGGTKIRVRDGATIFSFELISERPGFLGAMQGCLKQQAAPGKLFSTGEKWEAENKT